MEKTLEEMYKDLLNLDSVESYLGVQSDDDGEEFMTSKEVAKAQKETEERFGIKAPGSKSDIDETVDFKSYAVKRVHKYTETEMNQIRESCEETFVNDYGDNDIFHMSDEERKEKDMLSELSMKLGSLKRTYRRVDQYVEAMRIVVHAWKMLEKQANFLHTTDEFFSMVGEEKIVSNRIIMPKLKRMNDYNVDQLIKYISDTSLDPTDLVYDPKTTGSYDPENDFIEDRPEYQEFYDEYMDNLTDEDKENMDDYDIRYKADRYAKEKIEEEDMMRLLSDDEAQYLVDSVDSPPDINISEIPLKYIKGYDTRSTIRGSRKGKRLKRKDRAIQKDLHDLLLKLQNNPSNRNIDEYNRSYLITHGMFNTEKPPKDFWDDLYFDGSWANDAQVYMYDIASREELLKTRHPNERYMTYGDVELNRFFQIAERNGINVIELRRRMEISDTGVRESVELRESTKESKKLESQILQRLTKLNNDPKFKKLVEKSEKALNNYYSEQ